MLRPVSANCLSSSVHFNSVSFSAARIDLRLLTPDSSPLHPDPNHETLPPSEQRKPRSNSMSPSRHVRPLPNLVDGNPLSPDQARTFEKLSEMIDATLATKKCQTPTKDEKVVAGASVAHIAPHFFTSDCLRRYLVSRNFCEKKSYEMLMQTVHWREHNVPNEYNKSMFASCVESRYMEWLSHDKHGRPTLFMRSACANLDIAREIRVAFMIVKLERGLTLMKPQYSGREGVEQWNIVCDESGRGSKHTDNKFLSNVTPLLQSHYAQRLHRCYVINPGFITQIVFSVLKLFLDEGTTSKIRMLHAKHDKKNPHIRPVPELIEDLGAENVPTVYGGELKVPLVDEYCAFFESIPLPSK